MELNRNVENPMLIGTMELLRSDPSPEHKQLFVNEMVKARFLSPAMITPAPEVDEEGKGKLAPGCKIQFPMLTAPDGKHFFIAFTDKIEQKKWKEDGSTIVTLTMDEYISMTLRPDSHSSGCVINPYGANLVISKELMVSLMASRTKKSTLPAGKRDEK